MVIAAQYGHIGSIEAFVYTTSTVLRPTNPSIDVDISLVLNAVLGHGELFSLPK